MANDVIHRPITTANYNKGAAVVHPGSPFGSTASGVVLVKNEPHARTLDFLDHTASGAIATKFTSRFDDPTYYTA